MPPGCYRRHLTHISESETFKGGSIVRLKKNNFSEKSDKTKKWSKSKNILANFLGKMSYDFLYTKSMEKGGKFHLATKYSQLGSFLNIIGNQG
ncbi:MAG: hypothetical protein DRJ29_08690 [Bacteroidetes bacterium]|nr:MAG: hypothetical protein DRJ29_08690 [Bacteroidota bacterium]